MIQRSMLPSQFPPFPDRADFELHAAMVPAKEVGGDLFDFFLLDSERLGFVLGDVSGKGVPAALFMAIARTLLRAAAHHEASPGACLTYMNQSLVEQHASGNVRHAVLRNSQHPHGRARVFQRRPQSALRVFARRANPGAEGTLRPHAGRVRGVSISDAKHRASEAGEGILVYTDGVTEACNKQGDFYEESRLEAYLTAHASQPVDELVRGLHAEVERFEAGAPRADDITVLALRRRVG